MSILAAHSNCTITPALDPDLYGQEGLGTPRSERCAIVRSKLQAQHTTVRADASASRAYADEFIAQNRILLKADTQARVGDKLTVFVGTPAEVAIRIMAITPRTSVWGHLDHFEVGGEIWA